MEIINVVPHGYCQGVVRAIQIAKKTAADYPHEHICMLGMIVHNEYVVQACEKLGIRFIEDPHRTRLQLLDDIPDGVVIFTAHGISDAVREKAIRKGLTIVDASCPDVIRTHEIVRNHVNSGGNVLYIGKKGHPESEGTVGLSDRIHLITCVQDVEALPPMDHILIANQTTLSLYDVRAITSACLQRFPDAVSAGEICNATRMRQEAVIHTKADVLIVVGDRRSNNSNQLRQIGLASGIPYAYLIGSANSLREDMIYGKKRIAVTSGSSTPNELTDQVIQTLRVYADTGILNTHQDINLHAF